MASTEEEITIRFYEIERSGYYKRVDNDSKHVLCSISEMLDDLQNWIKDKTLEYTKTTSVLPNNSSLPVYCLGIEKSDSGNFLVTTWNEIESSLGQVASINKNQKIDNIKHVDMTPLPEDSIPGYSTYFWIIPKDNVLATVRFKHLEVGREKLALYMRGFLTAYSKYVIKEVDKDDKTKYNILGYGNDKMDCDNKMHPYFRTALIRKEGSRDLILNNIDQITKIIRKKTMEYNVQEDLDTFRQIFKNLFGRNDTKMVKPVSIKFEMDYKPSSEELVNMIDEWTKNNDREGWDDIGFKFTKDENMHWLSNEIPTRTMNVKIDRQGDELVHAHTLLKALEDSYSEIKTLYLSSIK